MSPEMQTAHMEKAIVAAATGERVLILGETMRSTDRIFSDVMHVLTAIPNSLLVYKTTRANGNPRIDFADAGNIRFLSVRSTLRGYTFDHVYVPADMEHDERLKEQIHWATLTSQTGEVTGYGHSRTRD